MKYKTSDLSKMLNVSANTIRRFAEKGYLSPQRDDDNQYRYFENSDVEKTTYISKYRKIGFGHEEIADMFQSDLFGNCAIYEKKMAELDKEIMRLKFHRHMLKDDINLIQRSKTYGEEFQEKNCIDLSYVSYKTDREMKNDKKRIEEVHRFLYDFPEIRYIYIVRKEDILKRRIRYEEAIAIRQELVDYLNLDVNSEVIEYYPMHTSIMRVVKLPIDFRNGNVMENNDVKTLLYDNFFAYMEEKGYVLAGDAVGVKIGFSKEEGQEMQYILFSMPVDLKK
ncbi:MAG: MerR family transcriptional regulator [Lachnospiraceae bacterium]|nr:MerR family transcriptional regulator [Lachnospiraceae bacterium]